MHQRDEPKRSKEATMPERTLFIATGALAVTVAVFASDVSGPGAMAQSHMTTQQAAQKTPTGSMAIPRVGWETAGPRSPHQIKANTQPRKGGWYPKGLLRRR
jgi:hypothetical protein